MLPKKELVKVRDELDNCSNPLFIFDKDTDGLCSFFLFYKYKKEGTGFPRFTKRLDEQVLKKIKELNPDKIFLLDIATNFITDDFVEGVNVPIIQVDHHFNEDTYPKIKVFNPRKFKKSDGSPTSSICYNVVEQKQNLWIAAIGCIFDWHITKEVKEFAKEHAVLISPKIKNPEEAIYESKLGKLGEIYNFLLKGDTTEIKKNIKKLLEVNGPEEILDQTTEVGKELYNYYERVHVQYDELYKRAEKCVTKDKFLVFKYLTGGDETFTSDLSTELKYRYPDKIVIVARVKDDYVFCSLRSHKIEIRSKLIEALKGLDGNGGGHELAVGATIKTKDFDTFLERFKALF